MPHTTRHRAEKRRPITVITGFLGAGKTTLLNHILQGDHGLRIAVLVNDFGEINIDSQLIQSVESDRLALTNGCICCSMRDDLLSALLPLLNEQAEIDHIVIEASGISNPMGIAATLFQPELATRLSIDGILAVVDAAAYPELNFADGELALEQMAVADLVILNKIDLATPEQLAQLREDLSYASPRARLLETTQAQAPLDMILGIDSLDWDQLPSHHSESHIKDHEQQHRFQTLSWTSDQWLDLDRFRTIVRDIPTSIVRAKGLVRFDASPHSTWIFQLVGKRSTLESADASLDVNHSQLVFIGHSKKDMERLHQQLSRLSRHPHPDPA